MKKEQIKHISNDKGHAQAMKDMTPSERILHTAAVLMAANHKIGSAIEGALEHGTPEDGTMMMSIPVSIAMDITNAMGEVVEILEEHKIVDRDEVVAFWEKKSKEVRAAAKEKGDVCAGCGQVHDDDDEESPLRGAAGLLAALLMGHMQSQGGMSLDDVIQEARRRGQEARDEVNGAPDGVTKH